MSKMPKVVAYALLRQQSVSLRKGLVSLKIPLKIRIYDQYILCQ